MTIGEKTEPTRRAMLALSAAAAASAAMTLSPRAEDGTQAPLPKVHVADNRIIGARVGLRPFRPSGFVVKSEPFGDKTLIHNYGHGGCGITLSWGTADMAA